MSKNDFQLDKLLQHPGRLKLIALLSGLGKGESASFVFLKQELEMTDGNLSAQISVLEEAGYVSVEKTFRNKRPWTTLQLTLSGRHSYEAHREALKSLLGLS